MDNALPRFFSRNRQRLSVQNCAVPLYVLALEARAFLNRPFCWVIGRRTQTLQQTTGVPGAFSDELALWDRQTRASLQQACERDFREEKVNA
ncbi:hypothetical protein J0B02_13470, partial [Enterobacteriaceae bacterium YMB-R22]